MLNKVKIILLLDSLASASLNFWNPFILCLSKKIGTNIEI